MPTQTEAGKAFEYALCTEAYNYLVKTHNVSAKNDHAYSVAKTCFSLFNERDQKDYLAAAHAAISHVIELEPRLQYSSAPSDILTLQIMPDSEGIRGDVRDVLFIRSLQNWEIGISAKNNHKAVKHSRLSDKIDFGKEWLNLNCSNDYFDSVIPLFAELRLLRERNELWKNLKDKATQFYIPILEAFKSELMCLDKEHPSIVPSALLNYLIGNKDFYKVIKTKKKTEIYGFNLHGTLNKPADNIKPKFKVSKLKLPNRIIELAFKPNSTNTLLLTFDEGWQISFRIHNASSKVEPSLKFDINLIGQPQSLYSNHMYW